MAKLIVKLNKVNRRVAFCDNCNSQIYAPSDGVIYSCCYNCGAKFKQSYSAKDIRELCAKPVEWDDNWRDKLKKNYPSCYDRFCNGKNIKSDIITIAKLMYEYNCTIYTKEDCLDRTLTWITGWNNQVELFPTNYIWYLDRV